MQAVIAICTNIRMNTEKKKKLREGFTTGTCAAAAAGAAVEAYFGNPPNAVLVDLPDNNASISVNIKAIKSLQIKEGINIEAIVIKDAGDDPDITNGAQIGAQVTIVESKVNRITIKGGAGVGKVTRPGLPVNIGESAINPVPLEMIEHEIKKRLPQDKAFAVDVVIFVKNGEMLAGKTLNPRLGIVGGLSILGTHGIVKPFSAKSYQDTIDICLRSARYDNQKTCILSTGRKSEKLAQKMYVNFSERCFVQTADFFSYALQKASDLGFEHIILSCFFGKLCKWAMNMAYTHAKSGLIDFKYLSKAAFEAGLSDEFCRFVEGANNSRQIFESAHKEVPLFVDIIGEMAIGNAWATVNQKPMVTICLWDYQEKFYKKWEIKVV
ncbi:MAG: cobalt-precorrin-5B (C(1))-methyltransferase CbiD [Pseudomonadota bacterium]